MSYIADERVLVLMPTVKDGERTARMLGAAGMDFAVCRDVHELCTEIRHGAGTALVTEEGLEGNGERYLQESLRDQPPWSDFPLVVLAHLHGRLDLIRESMNATLVERPVKGRSLLSVVRSALRSRRRQYEVRDHLAQLRLMQEELREADRKKDDFIALLAHELRNPLAPIRNGLQVLHLAAADPEATARAREMMERQLTHVVRLIDDLLDVSRIGRHKMQLRRERVALASVVGTAIETARPVLEAAEHQIHVSLPDRPVYLDADLTRLSQVLGNLLTNSAKYTDRGGQVWLSAEREGADIAIRVRDTGIGIPTESLTTIFDMFSQVDRTMERNAGGLGIGLALVKGLVEVHGGTVTAASRGQGQGSIFTVKLPVLPDAEGTAPPPNDTNGARPPGRRILVVDDNRDGAESLTLMLRLLGNDVRTAGDGVEAVEWAERFRPELILMDIGMPRLNGYDATRRIREHAWGADMAIVALTGWGQEHDRTSSREAGCDDHLVKPVSLPDLERMLFALNAANGAKPRGQ